MFKNITTFLSAVFAVSTWFGRETIKAWFFDGVLHMVTPSNFLVFEYGPPAIFAVLTLYLLYSPHQPRRTKKQMLSIALMIGGVAAFAAGVVMYKTETGHFPFGNGEGHEASADIGDRTQVEEPKRHNEKAYFDCSIALWENAYAERNANIHSISVFIFELKSPGYSIGTGPIPKYTDHSITPKGMNPIRCEITFYNDEPMFNVVVPIRIEIQAVIKQDGKITNSHPLWTLDAPVTLKQVSKPDNIKHVIYVYSFDVDAALEVLTPQTFSYSAGDNESPHQGLFVVPSMPSPVAFPRLVTEQQKRKDNGKIKR